MGSQDTSTDGAGDKTVGVNSEDTKDTKETKDILESGEDEPRDDRECWEDGHNVHTGYDEISKPGEDERKEGRHDSGDGPAAEEEGGASQEGEQLQLKL